MQAIREVNPDQLERERGAAGRGLEKLSRGLEKILGVGLNFKMEKPQTLCISYAKSIKRGHK